MIGAIVQARMGSTRLPGKVLLEAAGRPLLGHLIARLDHSSSIDQVVIATSTADRDNAIVEFCESQGVQVFRGSETDVLDRYYQTATHYEFDIVVRVTSDCPLIDPELIDRMVPFFCEHRHEFDLVTNRHPLTFPDGTDFDVTSLHSLEYVWEHATEPHQREHVVPYFWETGMRVHNFEHPDQPYYRHRWTLDYPEDYELITRILEALHQEDSLFCTQDILDYLDRNPELPLINAKYISAQLGR